MLKRLIGEDVELSAVVPPGLGRVCADPGQLEQVIVNLAVNARDAMPSGGALVIELKNADVDLALAAEHVGLSPGAYVTVDVRDTGAGIPPAVLRRIFEPFYTTKEVGKGTGLGLSTVYGIVKQSGGYVSVTSEVGHGTTFTVYLPRVAAKGAGRDEAHAHEAETSPRGTETILLVEDDEVMRGVTQEMLTDFGYRVVVAASADEALALYRTGPERPDVLVADVVMPRRSGRELADEVLAEQPDLPVLLMSGYDSDWVTRKKGADERMAFLQKPFTPGALARAIRNLLDGVPPGPSTPGTHTGT